MRNLLEVTATRQPYLNHHTARLAEAQERAAIVKRGWLAQVSASSPDALASESLPTVFKLYTEDKPVVRLVSGYFEGASLHHVTGIWQGNVEAGLVIEILAPYSSRKLALKLAADIALQNEQSAVLVTWHNARGFEQVTVLGERAPEVVGV